VIILVRMFARIKAVRYEKNWTNLLFEDCVG
jgi:hypothetical protein